MNDETRLRAHGSSFAVATPHAAASEAARDVLAGGGNALDAAIAAAATLTVVYPHMCAVGGDLIALHVEPDGRATVVNGSGAAPAEVPVATLAAQGPMPVTGPQAVTVPGAVAAWETLHRMGASRPLHQLLAPAIAAAREGVAIAPSLGRAIADDAAALRGDAGLRGLLFDRDGPLATGAALRQPALARSLEMIAHGGAAALYRGEVGRLLVRRLRVLGSAMTTEDLQAHESEVTAPLSGTFGDDEVLTAPPNSTGFVLLQALAAIERCGDADLLGGDADLLAEILRLATADRDRWLADPRVVDVPLERLLSDDHVAGLVTAARARRAAGGDRAMVTQARPTGDTIALVTADREGRGVVIIQSVFHAFGARILDPATGILCHNRGAFFTLDPDAPNVLAGGKRPAHTLMPVAVRREGRLVGLHGTMGGKGQPQIHAHLMLRLCEGADAAQAVAASRWVVGGLDVGSPADEVQLEGDAPTAAVDALTAAGFPLRRWPARDEAVGHAQVIRRADDGTLTAGSDPRADGAALAG